MTAVQSKAVIKPPITAKEVLTHVTNRLGDRWVIANGVEYNDEGKPYWAFSFPYPLSDELREELTRAFASDPQYAMLSVAVTTYREQLEWVDAVGFMVLVAAGKAFRFPIGKAVNQYGSSR